MRLTRGLNTNLFTAPCGQLIAFCESGKLVEKELTEGIITLPVTVIALTAKYIQGELCKECYARQGDLELFMGLLAKAAQPPAPPPGRRPMVLAAATSSAAVQAFCSNKEAQLNEMTAGGAVNAVDGDVIDGLILSPRQQPSVIKFCHKSE